MPFCTCLTSHGLVAHTVSGPEECGRLENLLENKEPGPDECRYEEVFSSSRPSTPGEGRTPNAPLSFLRVRPRAVLHGGWLAV
jgi:hypothetical protein